MALDFAKIYLEEADDFSKRQKKRIKELQSLYKERSSVSTDFFNLYETYIADLNNLQNEGLIGREKIQNILIEKEWQDILESIDKKSEKVKRKKSKKRAKLLKSTQKTNKKALKRIKRDEKRKIVKEHLDAYLSEYINYATYKEGLNYYDNKVLRNRHSSKADISVLLDEQTAKRTDLYNDYVLLHQILIENTDEKEWNKVVRRINRLF